MNLLIRGHIRNSFENNKLYMLVREISKICDLSIFIHTWNVVQNDLSWRRIKRNDALVDERLIRIYFRDLSDMIKVIMIDDDSKIFIRGNKTGYIGRTKCPVLGYKNMYYGMNRLCEYACDLVGEETAVQTRFDLMSNSCSIGQERVLDFVKANIGTKKRGIQFVSKDRHKGIDNLFAGSAFDMYRIVRHMHMNMDEIIMKYSDLIHQEYMLFFENEKFNFYSDDHLRFF